MFRHAITRTPAPSVVDGLTSSDLGVPDYDLALIQHRAYCDALESCDVTVTVLPPLDGFPDAVFVEDAALCTTECAVVTRPGAASRRDEAALLESDLRRFYDRIEYIEAPGTLDAGDVMMADGHFYIGQSERSNNEGVRQLTAILQRHGFSASSVPLRSVLHLKTGVAYLEHGRLLVAGEFVNAPVFNSFERIEIPREEAYAANSIWVNDRVLMPADHPHSQARVRALGYEVIEVDVSQFRKLDGGLSCLSLRF